MTRADVYRFRFRRTGPLLPLLLLACTQPDDLRERCRPVERNLAALAEKATLEQFDLRESAPFDWDRFFVFREYTPAAYIREATGLETEVREGFELFVFSVEGRPVCYLEHGTRDRENRGWSFAGPGEAYWHGVPQQHATFSVVRQGTEVLFVLGADSTD